MQGSGPEWALDPFPQATENDWDDELADDTIENGWDAEPTQEKSDGETVKGHVHQHQLCPGVRQYDDGEEEALGMRGICRVYSACRPVLLRRD